MTIRLTTSSQLINTRTFPSSTYPACYMQVNDYAYVYDVSSSSAKIRHVRQYYFNVPSAYNSYTAGGFTWCNNNGVYFAVKRNGTWSEENMGTHVWSSTVFYRSNNPNYMFTKDDWWTISLSNGYWSGVIQAWDIYPYDGLTKDNTLVSFDVDFQNSVAPANPTISNITSTNNSISFRLSESSWGIPSSGRWEYYWGDTSGTTANYVLNPTSGYTTNTYCDNTITGLTANKQYYIRYRVWNSALNNSSGLIETTPITKPGLPTYVANSLSYTSTTCSFRVSVAADGGKYNKTVRYSIDGGANYVNSNLTFTGGTAQTGTVNISGLSPYTTYTIRLDCSTSAGNAPGYNTVETFTTSPVAPSGLAASISEKYTNGAKIAISIASYGTPSSASGRYIEGGICATNDYFSSERYYVSVFDVSSASVTVTNVSIQSNKEYYYGIYANNTKANNYTTAGSLGTFVTLPAALTAKSVVATNPTTATVSYTTAADGGKYTKNIQYSLNNSTWTTGATVSSSSATSGTFAVTIPESSTTTIYLRVNTTSGSTSSGTLSITTGPAAKMYCSVGGESKKIKKLYCASPSKTITTVVTPTYISMINPQYFKNLAELDAEYEFYSELWAGEIMYNIKKNGTYISRRAPDTTTWAQYGVTMSSIPPQGYDTATYKLTMSTTECETKLVKKLYASVNGVAKLIYKNSQ